MIFSTVSETTIHSLDSVVIPVANNQDITLEYFRIAPLSPADILPACFQVSEALLYYFAPDASYSFIAGGLSPLPTDFNPEVFLSALKNATSLTNTTALQAPVIFTRKFFNSDAENALWRDFSSEWMIPGYVFFSKADESFLLCINGCMAIPEKILSEGNKISSEYFAGNHMLLTNTEFVSGCNADEFTESINTVTSEIRAGKITKAVFSRMQTAALSRADFTHFSEVLHRYPATHRFLFKSGSAVFGGASPELLLTLRENRLATEALAGTAARGNNPETDKAMGEALLHNQKELLEHKIVTDYITGILAEFSETLHFSTTPGIKRLNSLQHLWTPIEAELKAPEKIFTILNALFPTPATCGYPKKESLILINSLENYDRGLYCGALAWANILGDVDSFIPLRSALFAQGKIHVFSGGGIVAASDPEAEFEEGLKKADSIKNLFFA